MSLLRQLLTAGEIEFYIDYRSGTFIDKSGTHTTTKSGTMNINNKCAVFDFSSSIDIDGNIDIGTNDFSVLTKQKPKQYNSHAVQYASGTPFNFSIINTNQLSLYFDGTYFSTLAAIGVAINKWNTVCLSADRDGNVEYFVDGLSVASIDVSAKSAVNFVSAVQSPFNFVSRKSDFEYVVFLRRSLTSAEVAQLTAELESMKFPSKPSGKANKLKKRKVAKGDGPTGYITFPNASISGVADSDWSIAFLVNHASFTGNPEQTFGTFDTTGSTKRFYFTIDDGKLRLQIGTGGVADISTAAYMDVGVSYLIMLQFSDATGKITSKFLNMSTGTVTDGIEYTVVGLTELDDNVFGVLANSNGGGPSTGCVCDFRVWFSSVSFENMQDLSYEKGVNLSVDFDGNVIDRSGNGYDGTIVGDITFPEIMLPIETNPIYHKSDFGVMANELDITTGFLENTPYKVLTGTFKIISDVYNGKEVKAVECVGDGTLQLPSIIEGTVWTCYADFGAGYTYYGDPDFISSDVVTITTGDKFILGDIRGSYGIIKANTPVIRVGAVADTSLDTYFTVSGTILLLDGEELIVEASRDGGVNWITLGTTVPSGDVFSDDFQLTSGDGFIAGDTVIIRVRCSTLVYDTDTIDVVSSSMKVQLACVNCNWFPIDSVAVDSNRLAMLGYISIPDRTKIASIDGITVAPANLGVTNDRTVTVMILYNITTQTTQFIKSNYYTVAPRLHILSQYSDSNAKVIYSNGTDIFYTHSLLYKVATSTFKHYIAKVVISTEVQTDKELRSLIGLPSTGDANIMMITSLCSLGDYLYVMYSEASRFSHINSPYGRRVTKAGLMTLGTEVSLAGLRTYYYGNYCDTDGTLIYWFGWSKVDGKGKVYSSTSADPIGSLTLVDTFEILGTDRIIPIGYVINGTTRIASMIDSPADHRIVDGVSSYANYGKPHMAGTNLFVRLAMATTSNVIVKLSTVDLTEDYSKDYTADVVTGCNIIVMVGPNYFVVGRSEGNFKDSPANAVSCPIIGKIDIANGNIL